MTWLHALLSVLVGFLAGVLAIGQAGPRDELEVAREKAALAEKRVWVMEERLNDTRAKVENLTVDQPGPCDCLVCVREKVVDRNAVRPVDFFDMDDASRKRLLLTYRCTYDPTKLRASMHFHSEGPPPQWTDNLPCTELKKSSQNGEDGVISALFAMVGYQPGRDRHYYVEFGAGDGTETNTGALRARGDWTGLLMDGGYDNPDVNLRRETLHQGNIVPLFEKYSVPRDLDLLSVDTDCFDLWLLRAILDAGFRPRVMVVEVNAKWPTDVRLVIPPEHLVDRHPPPGGRCPFTEWHGASPAAYHLFARCFGYMMVYCERGGVNCFLVRKDLLPDGFTPQPPEQLWRTPRYGYPGGGWPVDPYERSFLHVASCNDIRHPERAEKISPVRAHRMAYLSAPSLPGEPKSMIFKSKTSVGR